MVAMVAMDTGPGPGLPPQDGIPAASANALRVVATLALARLIFTDVYRFLPIFPTFLGDFTPGEP